MSRLFRLLDKKRGDRRTGSNLVGSVGEALFCGGLFLLGVTSLSALIGAHFWQPERHWYAVGVGFWLMVAVLTSFIMMGGVGLIWTVLRLGISAERRSHLSTRASKLDLMKEAVPQPKDYPSLPSHDGLTNSPGIELAYRLPTSQSPGWRLLAKTIFALLWNGIACVLFVLAVKGWFDGEPEWFLTAFLVPYLGVSVWSISYLIQQIWIHAGMGPTTIEISDHPLIPGRDYEVHLSQAGHIQITSLEMLLRCEEEATYHQGTDIRHESRVVSEEQMFLKSDFQVTPGAPFQITLPLAIPLSAMHSFQSEHNAINWKLIVRGKLEHWPEFERSFPIVVYPGTLTQRGEGAPPSAIAKPAARPQRAGASAGREVMA